jgi:hypothetical protein
MTNVNRELGSRALIKGCDRIVFAFSEERTAARIE